MKIKSESERKKMMVHLHLKEKKSIYRDQSRSGLIIDGLSWVLLADGSSEEGHLSLVCSIYCYICRVEEEIYFNGRIPHISMFWRPLF